MQFLRLRVRFLAVLFCIPCSSHGEFALINLIRHGERDNNASNPHLAEVGYERAAYIGHCVATTHHTLAFPFGRPTRLMASLRKPKSKGQKESVRPRETLLPLSTRLSIPIDNHVNMEDVSGFVQYVQGMHAGETLLVAWQHWFLTFLVTALGFEGLVPVAYPRSCNYTEWTEPAYAMDEEEGDCYDVIWQLVLFRENASHAWRTDAFTQLHQGFGGRRDSPCASAFHPGSTPTHWAHASTVADTRADEGRGAPPPSSSPAAASRHGDMPSAAGGSRDGELPGGATEAAYAAEEVRRRPAMLPPSTGASLLVPGPASPGRWAMLHDLSLVAPAFALGAAVAFSMARRRRECSTEDNAAIAGALGAVPDEYSTEYRAA